MSTELSNSKLFIDPLFISILSNNNETSSIFLEDELKETKKKIVIEKYQTNLQIQTLQENSKFITSITNEQQQEDVNDEDENSIFSTTTTRDTEEEKERIEFLTKLNLVQIYQQKEIFSLNSKFDQFCNDINTSLDLQKTIKKIESQTTDSSTSVGTGNTNIDETTTITQQKKPDQIFTELKRKYSGQVLQAQVQQKTKKKKKKFCKTINRSFKYVV